MFVDRRFVQVVSSKGRTHALDTIPHTIVELEHILQGSTPSTFNPQLLTLNSKLETRNPKPEARNPNP